MPWIILGKIVIGYFTTSEKLVTSLIAIITSVYLKLKEHIIKLKDAIIKQPIIAIKKEIAVAIIIFKIFNFNNIIIKITMLIIKLGISDWLNVLLIIKNNSFTGFIRTISKLPFFTWYSGDDTNALKNKL